MAGSPDVLLTNDDGIDAPGLAALDDALSAVADVTVVAPAENQSATGRALSFEVDVEEHERGYAVDGTPADCVVFGLDEVCPAPDVVVSGCNEGANLGMYVLGRSGTVSAAVEAAFFGVPAIATSLYMPSDEWGSDHGEPVYDTAARATRHVVESGLDSGIFERVDYLNVNAPWITAEDPGMRVTRPSLAYDMGATYDGERVAITDHTWDTMANGTFDEDGTDRQAVLAGDVSVSPLRTTHATERHDALDRVAAAFGTA